MPELPNKIVRQYYQNIPSDRDDHGGGLGYHYKEKYKDDPNVLGSGGERIVVSDGESAVALVYNGDKYMVLATFYVHRLLHTLYPKNFPRFKAVYYSADDQIGIEFRDEIKYAFDYDSFDESIFSIDKVIQQLTTLGITRLGGNGTFGGEYIYPEFGNTGLITDEKGEKIEIFLDVVRPARLALNTWNFQKLYEGMTARQYVGHDIKAVLNAVLRISKLSAKKLMLIHVKQDKMHPSVVEDNILSDEQVAYIKSVLASF